MKKKSIIVLTACLAITLCVAGIGVAFAWYTSNVGAGNQLELDANGFLIVYFDKNEYTLGDIKPAVAVKGAVTDGATEFDVLKVGGNVAEKATVVVDDTGVFHYINQSDPDNPDVEADLWVFCDAYIVNADGSREKISLTYDLSVEIEITWFDGGVAHEKKIANDAWAAAANPKLTVGGNVELSITTTIYLRQVDDLCDPRITAAKSIEVEIKMGAIPTGEEQNQ